MWGLVSSSKFKIRATEHSLDTCIAMTMFAWTFI